LYRLRGAGLRNEPTEPAKSQLNGKKEALNGDQKRENPTHEHISDRVIRYNESPKDIPAMRPILLLITIAISLTSAHASDRTVAEWVLRMGGSVSIDGDRAPLWGIARLPDR